MTVDDTQAPPTPTGGEVLVLCYHALSDRWPAEVAVSPAALRSQLRHLLSAGFEPRTFSEAIAGGHAGRSLAVTFDDAYLSMFEIGFPMLAELGIPATVFVPTGYQDAGALRSWPGLDRWQGERWREELRGASWSQLGELAAAGWEIGSHTRTHSRLTGLDDASLAAELEGSRADCEDRLSLPCRLIAYPYGDCDARVTRAAQRAGYTAGATVSGWREPGGGAPDPLSWPRLGVRRADHMPRFRAKVALHRRPKAWNLSRNLRALGRRRAASD
jgi:peptidoglycan/xylan/chitin deacetylase (PgdA/CDA1 family)